MAERRGSDSIEARVLTSMDVARKAGLAVLPKSGAWVCLKGCGSAPRGSRIIPIHQEIGIRHLDIYWGFKEALVHEPLVHRFRRKNLRLTEAVYYDLSRGSNLDEALDRAASELLEWVRRSPFHDRGSQVTWITVCHPYPEEIRFFNSEVIVFGVDLIQELLAADYIQPITFGKTAMVVLEDAARELSDALQLDGLSKFEAYQAILAAEILEPTESSMPCWFYRSAGEFRRMFVEDSGGEN